jgi:hypothetical protein
MIFSGLISFYIIKEEIKEKVDRNMINCKQFFRDVNISEITFLLSCIDEHLNFFELLNFDSLSDKEELNGQKEGFSSIGDGDSYLHIISYIAVPDMILSG